jgi:8-oxo-dGTP pyrophosphatase MutT (NUDIX family)
MKEISAGSVIYKKMNTTIKYVIIHQIHGNHFGFPKGHVETHESLEETIKRECLEEVGIEIEIIGYPMYNHYQIKDNIEKEVTYMLSKTEASTLRYQQEELYEANFLTYEEAMKKLTYQRDQEILTFYHQLVKEFI